MPGRLYDQGVTVELKNLLTAKSSAVDEDSSAKIESLLKRLIAPEKAYLLSGWYDWCC